MNEEKGKVDISEELKKCKTIEDLTGKDGLFKKILKDFTEEVLDEEMKQYLGYPKYDATGKNSGNNRNGKSTKTVRSNFGEMELSTPRDRNGQFDPKLVKKYQRDISDLDNKIISMYAKGMTVRDIQVHVEDLYGAEISPAQISIITDKVMDLVTEWQSRSLNNVYPIVFFDAIHYKIRENAKVLLKAAYTCLGIDLNGRREILGIWIGQSEGAHFWLNVCNELKNRGVEDILVACVDGLKGFPEAIAAVFPKAEIQSCIIHQIRNSLKYVSWKNQKAFIADLKLVYKAPTLGKAEAELENLSSKWNDQYPLVIKSWKSNWPLLSTYFKYPQEIRKIIYTTNAVEQLHRQFRKVTKNRGLFPNDEALLKMLFLASRDIEKKWTKSIQNWSFTISQLAIIFNGRIQLDL